MTALRYPPARWAAPAAVCWALLLGAFALVCTLRDRALFIRNADQAGPVALNWVVVGTAVLALFSVAAARRHRAHQLTTGLIWASCALSAVSGFTLLMDVIELAFNQRLDSGIAAVHHLLGLLGVLLLAANARALRPEGRTRYPAVPAAPSPAPPRVQWAARAGALAFVPYAAMKMFWAMGGRFAGVGRAELQEASRRNGASEFWLTLESWGIDGTVVLAALGVFLLLGLVRPWGQVFPHWTLALRGRPVPRWLPLTPALIGAMTLGPYGLLGTTYTALGSAGLVSFPRGDFPSVTDCLEVSWIGNGAFALYGTALALAAHSYWVRTRPGAPAGGARDRATGRPGPRPERPTAHHR
ncbi:hypothetical protein [Streptomyces orinoci]|uniref:Uncharacterized protein n=1 Tax=Streptomyces orinoci TaxID=67339 RepID=A0ABV3JZR6_STRON|nr:hypothetical protein [Streptomyces orinoci]